MQHTFTVFTPTYNRANLLVRVYESLKKQTFKDFEWLIISDGSNDGTSELVKSWIDEKIIDIKYYWQENNGKPSVLKKAFEMFESDYLVDIDDDDIMLPDCLQLFYDTWNVIRQEGKYEVIGSCRALTIDHEGNVVNGKKTDIGRESFDSNYLDIQIAGKGHWENITCWKRTACRKVDMFHYAKSWYGQRISFVSESIFWSRFARKFQTRYIFVPLREYSYTEQSITRGKNNMIKKWGNSAYSTLLLLNENYDYFWRNPFMFIKQICIYLTFMQILGFCSLGEAIRNIKSKRLRFCGGALLPVVFLLKKYLLCVRYKGVLK